MMGANHAITGAAAWVAATAAIPALQLAPALALPLSTGAFSQSPTTVIGGAIIAAGAALLPDADHHSATIAHSVPVVGKLVTGAISDIAGGHRKGTHTILAAAIILGLSMLLRFCLWDTHTWFGTVSIGAGLATMGLTAFAGKVIKSITFVRTWLQAWVFGAIIGAAVMLLLPNNQAWLPVAITLGFIVHLLGDMLTVGGIAPFYPWVPKPPLWWQGTPVLNRLWQKNGYMGVPILGLTGSIREWSLGALVTVYVLYAVTVEGFAAVGINFGRLLLG